MPPDPSMLYVRNDYALYITAELPSPHCQNCPHWCVVVWRIQFRKLPIQFGQLSGSLFQNRNASSARALDTWHDNTQDRNGFNTLAPRCMLPHLGTCDSMRLVKHFTSSSYERTGEGAPCGTTSRSSHGGSRSEFNRIEFLRLAEKNYEEPWADHHRPSPA